MSFVMILPDTRNIILKNWQHWQKCRDILFWKIQWYILWDMFTIIIRKHFVFKLLSILLLLVELILSVTKYNWGVHWNWNFSSTYVFHSFCTCWAFHSCKSPHFRFSVVLHLSHIGWLTMQNDPRHAINLVEKVIQIWQR